jgi:hypothetical protein
MRTVLTKTRRFGDLAPAVVDGEGVTTILDLGDSVTLSFPEAWFTPSPSTAGTNLYLDGNSNPCRRSRGRADAAGRSHRGDR